MLETAWKTESVCLVRRRPGEFFAIVNAGRNALSSEGAGPFRKQALQSTEIRSSDWLEGQPRMIPCKTNKRAMMKTAPF